MSALTQELERLRDCAVDTGMPYVLGRPEHSADYRVQAEDFRVAEQGAQPCGNGEHLLLRIRKTGQNTRWVAKRIAEKLGVAYRMVSYAGLKDRHAVTEQWFGVHLPGQPNPEAAELDIEGVEVLAMARHDRKLRPGQLSYNQFDILLRNVSGLETEPLQARLADIEVHGVPNYFGPQRFGRDLNNLRLPSGDRPLNSMNREQRAFVISALRGALFNGYLARRVSAGTWKEGQAGEVLITDRPRGLAEEDTSVFLPVRLPTGLLWGQSDGLTLMPDELDWFGSFPAVTALLTAAGSRPSRRSLVCRVARMAWRLEDEKLRMSFALGPGAYATTVLREVININNASQVHDKEE